MVAFVRAKQVTDLLDKNAKGLLCDGGYDEDISSGSEHEGASVLSSNPHGLFFSHVDEEEYNIVGGGMGGDDGSGDDDGGEDETKTSDSSSYSGEMICDLVKNTRPDRFRNELNGVVLEFTDKISGVRHCRSVLRRIIMSTLRDSGYDAGDDQKTSTGDLQGEMGRWRSEGKRYIVEVDFASDFEIAQPTQDYEKLVAELPRVYIGKPEELRRVVRVIADAGKELMRARKMRVLPWRKVKFMQNKWFGSYKRKMRVLTLPAISLMTKVRVDFGREIHYGKVGCWLDKLVVVPPAK